MSAEPSTNSSDSPSLPLSGSPCLQGERVAFTGTLASMTHREAFDLVERHGGSPAAHVSRQTTMIVVGEEGWPLEADGRPSQKLQQALECQRAGAAIRVLNESEWLRLLGLDERGHDVHRLYTPSMLSATLGVPVSVIRGWERAGLIEPVQKVFRLPYFDFQEVTGARRLVDLMSAGVPRRVIEASLARLRHVLPGVDRPLAQLDVLERDARLLYRDEAGLIEPLTGQRFFDFDRGIETPAENDDLDPAVSADPEASLRFRGPPPLDGGDARLGWSPAEWFREGCAQLNRNDAAAAVESFRLALMDQPGDPELNFHLAESLYRLGNTDGALERYYAAVESDHQYLEAWTQLGCVLLEKGDLEAAGEAFDVALDLHPDYPDAHLHKAETLDRLGRPEEALVHWRTYLEFDTHGPWAERARQRLDGGSESLSGTGDWDPGVVD